MKKLKELPDIFINNSFSSHLDFIETQIAEYCNKNNLIHPYKKKNLNEEFTIMFIGEYNAGKSSLINLLVGNTIVPTGSVPTTKYIYKLRHGSNKIIIYFADSQKEISYNDISKLNEVCNNKTVKYIEIYLSVMPEKLCLIDTPGTNDINNLNNHLIYEEIPKCDILFFIMNVQQAVKKTELEFLKNKVFTSFFNNIVFIINKCDSIDLHVLKDLKNDYKISINNLLSKIKFDFEKKSQQHLSTLVKDAINNLTIFYTSCKSKHNNFDYALLMEEIKNRITILYTDTKIKNKALRFLKFVSLEKRNNKDILCSFTQSKEDIRNNLNHINKQLREYYLSLHSKLKKVKKDITSIEKLIDKELKRGQKNIIKLSNSLISNKEIDLYKQTIEKKMKTLSEKVLSKVNQQINRITEEFRETSLNLSNNIGSINYDDSEDGPFRKIMSDPLNQMLAWLVAPIFIWQLGLVGVIGILSLPFIDEYIKNKNYEKQIPKIKNNAIDNIEMSLNKLNKNFKNMVNIKIYDMFNTCFEDIDILQNKIINYSAVLDNTMKKSLAENNLELLNNLEKKIYSIIG